MLRLRGWGNLRRLQAGASLTEMLLATSVSMMMLVWVAKMQAQSMEDMRAKLLAEQYQSLRIVAEQYFAANRSAMVAAMNTGTGAATWCTVNDVAKKLCLVDVAKLKANGAVAAWYKEVTPQNQRLYLAYRLVNASTGMTELLIYGGPNGASATPVQTGTSSLAAQMMGENGGIIPNGNIGSCATTQACGVGGGWLATLTNFTSGAVTAMAGPAGYSVLM